MLSESGRRLQRRRNVLRFDASTLAATPCPYFLRNGKGFCRDHQLELAIRASLVAAKEAEVLQEAQKLVDTCFAAESGESGNNNATTANNKEVYLQSVIRDLKKEKKYADWDANTATKNEMLNRRAQCCPYAHHPELLVQMKSSTNNNNKSGTIAGVIATAGGSVLTTNSPAAAAAAAAAAATSSSGGGQQVLTLPTTSDALLYETMFFLLTRHEPLEVPVGALLSLEQEAIDGEEDDVSATATTLNVPLNGDGNEEDVDPAEAMREYIAKRERMISVRPCIALPSKASGALTNLCYYTNQTVPSGGSDSTTTSANNSTANNNSTNNNNRELVVPITLSLAHFPALVEYFAPVVFQQKRDAIQAALTALEAEKEKLVKNFHQRNQQYNKTQNVNTVSEPITKSKEAPTTPSSKLPKKIQLMEKRIAALKALLLSSSLSSPSQPTVPNTSVMTKTASAVALPSATTAGPPLVTAKQLRFDNGTFIVNFFALVARATRTLIIHEETGEGTTADTSAASSSSSPLLRVAQQNALRVTFRALSMQYCDMKNADELLGALRKDIHHRCNLRALDLSHNKLDSLKFLFQLKATYFPSSASQAGVAASGQALLSSANASSGAGGGAASASFGMSDVEVCGVMPRPRLVALWLARNPITNKPEYRQQVRQMLPQLLMLDGERLRKLPLKLPYPTASRWNLPESAENARARVAALFADPLARLEDEAEMQSRIESGELQAPTREELEKKKAIEQKWEQRIAEVNAAEIRTRKILEDAGLAPRRTAANMTSAASTSKSGDKGTPSASSSALPSSHLLMDRAFSFDSVKKQLGLLPSATMSTMGAPKTTALMGLPTGTMSGKTTKSKTTTKADNTVDVASTAAATPQWQSTGEVGLKFDPRYQVSSREYEAVSEFVQRYLFYWERGEVPFSLFKGDADLAAYAAEQDTLLSALERGKVRLRLQPSSTPTATSASTTATTTAATAATTAATPEVPVTWSSVIDCDLEDELAERRRLLKGKKRQKEDAANVNLKPSYQQDMADRENRSDPEDNDGPPPPPHPFKKGERRKLRKKEVITGALQIEDKDAQKDDDNDDSKKNTKMALVSASPNPELEARLLRDLALGFRDADVEAAEVSWMDAEIYSLDGIRLGAEDTALLAEYLGYELPPPPPPQSSSTDPTTSNNSNNAWCTSFAHIVDADYNTFTSKFLHPSANVSVSATPGVSFFDSKRMFSKADVITSGSISVSAAAAPSPAAATVAAVPTMPDPSDDAEMPDVSDDDNTDGLTAEQKEQAKREAAEKKKAKQLQRQLSTNPAAVPPPQHTFSVGNVVDGHLLSRLTGEDKSLKDAFAIVADNASAAASTPNNNVCGAGAAVMNTISMNLMTPAQRKKLLLSQQQQVVQGTDQNVSKSDDSDDDDDDSDDDSSSNGDDNVTPLNAATAATATTTAAAGSGGVVVKGGLATYAIESKVDRRRRLHEKNVARSKQNKKKIAADRDLYRGYTERHKGLFLKKNTTTAADDGTANNDPNASSSQQQMLMRDIHIGKSLFRAASHADYVQSRQRVHVSAAFLRQVMLLSAMDLIDLRLFDTSVRGNLRNLLQGLHQQMRQRYAKGPLECYEMYRRVLYPLGTLNATIESQGGHLRANAAIFPQVNAVSRKPGKYQAPANDDDDHNLFNNNNNNSGISEQEMRAAAQRRLIKKLRKRLQQRKKTVIGPSGEILQVDVLDDEVEQLLREERGRSSGIAVSHSLVHGPSAAISIVTDQLFDIERARLAAFESQDMSGNAFSLTSAAKGTAAATTTKAYFGSGPAGADSSKQRKAGSKQPREAEAEEEKGEKESTTADAKKKSAVNKKNKNSKQNNRDNTSSSSDDDEAATNAAMDRNPLTRHVVLTEDELYRLRFNSQGQKVSEGAFRIKAAMALKEKKKAILAAATAGGSNEAEATLPAPAVAVKTIQSKSKDVTAETKKKGGVRTEQAPAPVPAPSAPVPLLQGGKKGGAVGASKGDTTTAANNASLFGIKSGRHAMSPFYLVTLHGTMYWRTPSMAAQPLLSAPSYSAAGAATGSLSTRPTIFASASKHDNENDNSDGDGHSSLFGGRSDDDNDSLAAFGGSDDGRPRFAMAHTTSASALLKENDEKLQRAYIRRMLFARVLPAGYFQSSSPASPYFSFPSALGCHFDRTLAVVASTFTLNIALVACTVPKRVAAAGGSKKNANTTTAALGLNVTAEETMEEDEDDDTARLEKRILLLPPLIRRLAAIRLQELGYVRKTTTTTASNKTTSTSKTRGSANIFSSGTAVSTNEGASKKPRACPPVLVAPLQLRLRKLAIHNDQVMLRPLSASAAMAGASATAATGSVVSGSDGSGSIAGMLVGGGASGTSLAAASATALLQRPIYTHMRPDKVDDLELEYGFCTPSLSTTVSTSTPAATTTTNASNASSQQQPQPSTSAISAVGMDLEARDSIRSVGSVRPIVQAALERATSDRAVHRTLQRIFRPSAATATAAPTSAQH